MVGCAAGCPKETEHKMSDTPYVPTTSRNIERANRLLALRAHPGFLEILRISQDLVDGATAICTDFPGWDPQQVMMLKCRAQAAKEHHALLISAINDAIAVGIAEDRENLEKARTAAEATLEKTPAEVVETGDYVRQRVLETFDQMADNRIAGSYDSTEK